MKNGKLKRITRRAVSMLLAALTVLPVDLLSLSANAAPASNEVMKPISTTWTKFVVWDFIEDMQELGQAGADYHPSNETHNIDVGDTKYTRILFYQNVGNDYYYFNASPTGGPKKGDGLTTYYEDQITLDAPLAPGTYQAMAVTSIYDAEGNLQFANRVPVTLNVAG